MELIRIIEDRIKMVISYREIPNRMRTVAIISSRIGGAKGIPGKIQNLAGVA